MKILVASKNPVKINAVKQGFAMIFPHEQFDVEGLSKPSGVRDQPMDDAETIRGAWNRAHTLKDDDHEADYYVGIEGGIEDSQNDMEAFAWVVIVDANGHVGKARTGTFFLPKVMADMVRSGTELGHADDAVTGRTNSKQEGSTVGFLTGEAIDRTAYYAHAVGLALARFKHPSLFARS